LLTGFPKVVQRKADKDSKWIGFAFT